MRIAFTGFDGLAGRIGRAAFALLSAAALGHAGAVPLYAHQTGQACAACHVAGNYPELTPFGRKFKALGYTLGNRTIPLSAMVLGGYSALNNQNGSAQPEVDFAHDRSTQLQAISLFTGGKIVDHVGAFVQWTYDGVAHHSALDNTDIRYADSGKLGGSDIVWGVTLNNNPTVQDLYNSTPAWGYPYVTPAGAFQGFGAQPVVMGGLAAQVAGVGAYVDWNDMLYLELSGYKTADGVFSVLRKGSYNPDPNSVGFVGPYAISGTAPYWRIALHGASGPHDWMVGTFGFDVKQYSDSYDSASPLIHFTDTALDAQYHYTAGDWSYSAIGAWIHEKQRYDASVVGAGAGYDNASNTLDWRQLKLGAMWRSKYGGSVTFFGSSGSADTQLYAANTNPRPDTSGTMLELDWLPHPQVKLGVQYILYSKFNGSSSNYDASGTFTNRNAKDNNTLGLFVWAAF